MGKINPSALGYAAAIMSASIMLLLGIGANIGIYKTAAEQMVKWHMFFSFDAIGIMTGMLEGAVISYVLAYAFAWLYNMLNKAW